MEKPERIKLTTNNLQVQLADYYTTMRRLHISVQFELISCYIVVQCLARQGVPCICRVAPNKGKFINYQFLQIIRSYLTFCFHLFFRVHLSANLPFLLRTDSTSKQSPVNVPEFLCYQLPHCYSICSFWLDLRVMHFYSSPIFFAAILAGAASGRQSTLCNHPAIMN